VLVPTFVHLLDQGDQAAAEEVAGRVLGVALLVLGAITVVGVLASPLLADLLTAGAPASTQADQSALVAFLLPFFLPQVLMYAAGTIASAVLYARHRFAITAAAPIGNTVIMVAILLIFRAVAGEEPGLDLSLGEKLLLAAAGTGGVLGFVGLLLVACHRSGFRLRPQLLHGDTRVTTVLRHSGWGVALHSAGGLLLGAAVLACSGVDGAVVAYNSAWVFFLAPYAVLAQPIHTAILPEMAREAREHGTTKVAASLRWALERMSLLLIPVTAAMAALAAPAMRLFQFGPTDLTGVELLAAALAGFAVGLLPYSAFLLLARGYYALDESRFPGLVAIGSAACGVVVMIGGAVFTEGNARLAVLGLAHSFAYLIGALVLGVALMRRTGVSLVPAAFARMVVIALVAGGGVWLAGQALLDQDPSRLADLGFLAAAGIAGGAVVLGGYRLLGVSSSLGARH
jgi:putative peptidoglycan lipid II flippase